MIITNNVVGQITYHDIIKGELNIPECVTEIPSYFCCGWDILHHVSIPSTIKKIGAYAFSHCNKLHYNTKNNIDYLGNGKYKYLYAVKGTNCKSINDIEAKIIGDEAFINNTNLVDIKLPNNVISIGDRAFAFCKNLKSISIPLSIENIGKDIFLGCANLETITISSRYKAQLGYINQDNRVKIIYADGTKTEEVNIWDTLRAELNKYKALELVRRTHLSENSITLYRRGLTVPSLLNAQKLADAIGMELLLFDKE